MVSGCRVRGPALRQSSSPRTHQPTSYLHELYRARANKAGIRLCRHLGRLRRRSGRYVQDGPDFEGQTRRRRTYDGVNFTKAGAEKLGRYVEHDLRRLVGSHVLPVATG
jgi:hypothetical protein